jgi:hydroxymethylpyrimidine/phosphomethylpyrimidine kinase
VAVVDVAASVAADAVAVAKTFVTRAIAAGVRIGQGHAPLNHRAGLVPYP